jgi:hypothetical protein
MIYIGSGAEYGKHRAIVNAAEDAFGQELPRDAYGLSRYLMSEIAVRQPFQPSRLRLLRHR